MTVKVENANKHAPHRVRAPTQLAAPSRNEKRCAEVDGCGRRRAAMAGHRGPSSLSHRTNRPPPPCRRRAFSGMRADRKGSVAHEREEKSWPRSSTSPKAGSVVGSTSVVRVSGAAPTSPPDRSPCTRRTLTARCGAAGTAAAGASSAVSDRREESAIGWELTGRTRVFIPDHRELRAARRALTGTCPRSMVTPNYDR